MTSKARRTAAVMAAFGLIAGGAVMAGAGAANAAGTAVGGCPVGFELKETAWISTQGTFYGLSAADLNGDGWSCVRFLPKSPTELAFTDNRLPLP